MASTTTQTIAVSVRTLNHGEETYVMSRSEPHVLGVLKGYIAERTGVPVSRQRLLHRGKEVVGDGGVEALGWGGMGRVTLHLAGAVEEEGRPTDPAAVGPGRPDPRGSGNVLHALVRTFTGGDGRTPVAAMQEVAAAFGFSNASVVMDFVEGMLVDLNRSISNGLEAAAAQLRSEATTEAMAPSVELVNSMIAAAVPQIVERMRTAMRDHLSFLENNAEFVDGSAPAAVPADGTAAADAAADGAAAPVTTTTSASSSSKSSSKQPTLPPKKGKPAPGGLGLGGGLKKKPSAKPKSSASASASAGPPSTPAAANNPMQQMMGMLGGGGGGGAANGNPLGGLLGGLMGGMGGRPQQPEAPLDVDEVLAKEIQVDEERQMWKSTVDQMEAMAAARGSNGAPELPPLSMVYLASIPDNRAGGSALDQIFELA